MLNEINTKPLRESIADSIRESIITGKLKPGERLLEVNIAKILGVSRTPAREAFLQLDTEGFLEILPRKGAVVSSLSAKDAEELYSVRSVLEGLAARLSIPNISDEIIDELILLNNKIESASKGKVNNPKMVIEINHRFHDIINKDSRNEKLCQMIELLRKQTMRYNQIYLSFIHYLQRSIEQHKEIIEALELRDADLAEKVMRKHVESAGDALCEYIKIKEVKS
jgi:DNA-binding GntR family transcriptional regulator